jgi:hypothetical protein
VYLKKIEADAIDDAQGNDRQNACEFLYDFMLNSYGLKGLAESAIHGVFKRIKQMMIKGIDKSHKVKIYLCAFSSYFTTLTFLKMNASFVYKILLFIVVK